MNRRNFLQMLGIGGATLAVSTTAAASPIVPLFSGKESKLWTPEHTSLTRSHLILTREGTVPWSAAAAPRGADPNVLRLMRKSWPTVPPQEHRVRGEHFVLRHHDDDPHQAFTLADRDLGGNVAPVTFKLEGQDPHLALYRASMEMRDRFAKQSHDRLMAIPEWKRPQTTLVTLVDTPIFASSWDTASELWMRVQISYTAYAVRDAHDIELNGWHIFSENGEYPVEVPTEIDMDRLLSIDTEVFTGKLNLLQLRGKTITL